MRPVQRPLPWIATLCAVFASTPALAHPLGFAAVPRALAARPTAAALLRAVDPNPRNEVVSAYHDALAKARLGDYVGAGKVLQPAIQRAVDTGLGDDPIMAAPYAVYGALLLRSTSNRETALSAMQAAVSVDGFAQLPPELATGDTGALLETARQSHATPRAEPIRHTPPPRLPWTDIGFGALLARADPRGQVVVYWRKPGEAQFTPMRMQTLGNFAWVALSADVHQDLDVQYFIMAFDANNQTIAAVGDPQQPFLLVAPERASSAVRPMMPVTAGPQPGPVPGAVTSDAGLMPPPIGRDRDRDRNRGRRSKKPNLSRFFVHLGMGTGFGVVPKSSTAEKTYAMYDPSDPGASYGAAEQACAIARWWASDGPLPADAAEFQTKLTANLQGISGAAPPAGLASLAGAYDAKTCSARQGMSGGAASAPFHLSPEFGVRLGKKIVVSLFGRLQVVTGSKVFRDDPRKDWPDSFANDVNTATPSPVRDPTKFTWAAGAKFRYFLLDDTSRFRLFAGGLAGGGAARLRVNLGFANDQNGNSVPDEREAACSASGNPVWPYWDGCASGAAADEDKTQASTLSDSAADDKRIDTVLLGPGFVGGLFGMHYQVHPNVALFAEVDVSVWFPRTSSLLVDLTLGPVLTF